MARSRRAGRRRIAGDPRVFFTTHHFDGYPAVLCRLDALDGETLAGPAGEAWACRTPKRLLAEHRAAQ